MQEAESSAENSGAEVQGEAVVVDYEQSEEVQKMLKGSPFALPLPVEALKENRVAVSDIPKGLLLTRYEGDLEVRVSSNSSMVRSGALDTYRKTPRADRSVSEWSSGEREASLVSTPLPGTNMGRNPNSRLFIRGVLHNQPLHLYLGAITTFLIVWLVPAALVSTLLLILSVEMPEQFEWVPHHLIWVPAALLVIGTLYLIFGLSSRCCVCNQKLFIYRSKLKNTKAHHLPGLGYVLPLSIHLMLFRWFRCSHCGTPVRLKK